MTELETAASPAGRPRPVIAGLFRYVRHPRPFEPHGPGRRAVGATKLWGFDLLLAIPLVALAALGDALISGETFVADDGLSTLEIVMLGIVVAPLIEETMFRLWLAPYRPAFLIGGGTVLTLAMADPDAGLLNLLVIPGLALVGLGLAGVRSPERRDRIAPWWDRHFGIVFFASVATFGLVHLSNYDFAGVGAVTVIAAPLLVAPQLAGGMILGYGRVRLGFWYGVAMHSAFNAVLTIPELIG